MKRALGAGCADVGGLGLACRACPSLPHRPPASHPLAPPCLLPPPLSLPASSLSPSLPAGELYDQIRLQGRLPEATAAAYAGEVVLMLRYLRQQGVVHRDLKPENLLLDGEGHLKLIDFGSAKQLAPEEEQAAHADAPPDAAAKAGGAAAKHAAAQPGSVAAAVVDGAAAGGEDGGTEAGGSDAEQAGGSGEEEPLAEASQSSEEEGEGAGADGEAGPRAEGGSGLGAERSKRAVSLVGTADYVSPEVGGPGGQRGVVGGAPSGCPPPVARLTCPAPGCACLLPRPNPCCRHPRTHPPTRRSSLPAAWLRRY